MSFFWNRFLAVPEDPDGMMSPPAYFYRLPDGIDTLGWGPFYAYASDPEVARYVLWEPHRSIGETRSFIRYLRSLSRAGCPTSWAVTLKETGKVIGTMGFIWYSDVNRSAELGYSFSREYWNRGYATQALKAVIGAVFRSLPVNRLEAQHDVRNPASGRVMEKCGLRQEGILRDRIVNKGEYVDVALYAILRSEWEADQR